LKDDQSLKDVFSTNGQATQNCFTVHLAYSRMLSTRFQQSSTPPQQTPKTPVQENLSGTAAGNNGQTPTGFSVPYSVPNLSNIQTGMSPDLIAMHEFYLTQMMAYMMQWSQISYQVLQSTGAMDPNSPVPSPAFTPNTVPQPQPQVQNNVVPNVAADHARNNELGNREDDEAPRDMLDWLYTLVRVAFIFSVVYFYSNFIRFSLVVICTALVVIFQRRQVARQAAQNQNNQRQEHPANPVPPHQPEQRPANDNPENSNSGTAADEHANRDSQTKTEASPSTTEPGPSHAGVADEGNANITADNQHAPQAPVANVARLSIRDITWTFFTTFFSSLIPEMPQNN